MTVMMGDVTTTMMMTVMMSDGAVKNAEVLGRTPGGIGQLR